MALTYDQLEAGFEFPPGSFSLETERVSNFIKAVGDTSQAYQDSATVPPMAIAALAMSQLSETVSLPPGSIHLSQELTFLNTVNRGDTLTSYAKLSRAQKRGKFHIMTVDYDVRSQSGNTVLTGKTSFMLPQEGE